jgi:hypothetical protein
MCAHMRVAFPRLPLNLLMPGYSITDLPDDA